MGVGFSGWGRRADHGLALPFEGDQDDWLHEGPLHGCRDEVRQCEGRLRGVPPPCRNKGGFLYKLCTVLCVGYMLPMVGEQSPYISELPYTLSFHFLIFSNCVSY